MKPQRWQRRKHARIPEILDAALACFAEKGFAGTRMDDIAARAGISKGTIYLYFDSKEAVFKALARQSIGAQLESVLTHVKAAQGSSAELLRFVIGTLGGFASTSDRVVLAKVLLAEAGNFPELAEFWRREIVDRGVSLFETIIRRGITRGEFRDVAPAHAARLCIAPVLLTILWRTVFAQFDETPYDYSGLIDAHLDTLLRGLAALGEGP
ncbi:MAG: TetR/AcrR family transcriptional regulator [Alphaproteobacteria bacterium]|nr:TetR/AcrR family transcriptional regulator [Alphaproteobacteria bacterium]